MTLNEFIVKIGFDSDRVSLRRAKGDLNSLSAEAARVAAVFAGAFTAKKITVDTGQAILNMDRLADKVGTTAQTIQSLSTISARDGGGFDAIAQQLSQIDFLRTQRESDLAGMFSEFGITGLDPSIILNAESTVDAYLNLIDVINKTEDTAKKKQFVRLLQFDDSFLRMTQNSRKELESLIAAEESRLIISNEAVDSAKRFNDALINSQTAVKNISTVINEAITPSIEQMVVKLNNLADDPDTLSGIRSVAKFVEEHLEGMAIGGALLVAFSVLEKTARKIYTIIAASIALARKLTKIGRSKSDKGGNKTQGNKTQEKPQQGQDKSDQNKPQDKSQDKSKDKPQQGQDKSKQGQEKTQDKSKQGQGKPKPKPKPMPMPDPTPDPNYKPSSDPKPDPNYKPNSDSKTGQGQDKGQEKQQNQGQQQKQSQTNNSNKRVKKNGRKKFTGMGFAGGGSSFDNALLGAVEVGFERLAQVAGAAVGGVAGSAVFPGGGTVAGAAIGATAGELAGEALGEFARSLLTDFLYSHEPVKQPPVQLMQSAHLNQPQSLMDTSSINSGYINSMARDAVMQSVRPLSLSQSAESSKTINLNNAITLELDGQVIDKRMNQLLIDTSNITDDAIKSSMRG